MLVKVLIKRRAKKDTAMDVFKQLRRIRSKGMNQEGYISGETLIDADDPQKILVVSTWGSLESWHSWKENEERKAMNVKLEDLLEGPTEYESFVYSKYYLKVSTL